MNKIAVIIFSIFIFSSCDKEEPTPVVNPQSPTFITNDKIVSLNIDVDEEIPIGEEIDMFLSEMNGDLITAIEGKIERRGGFSIGFDKHSYKLDLKGEYSFAGLPEDDDWILNANYIDKTFMRHRYSFELFEDMHVDNISPQCAYANVDLNYEYHGFYLLTERLDKSSLAIDGESTQAVIFKEPPLFIEEDINPQNPGNYYQQTYPDIDEDDRTYVMDELRTFLFTGTNEEFDAEIESIFDMANIIDWHLLLLLSNNNDGVLKNFYLYKTNDNGLFKVAPWDYDHSFGRDGDNELNLLDRVVNPERSILFKRLMEREWYKARLKSRWQELNDQGVFSLENLKNRVEVYNDIIRPHTDRNFDKWSVDSNWYYDNNGYDVEVGIFHQYLDLRHPNLQEYIDQL